MSIRGEVFVIHGDITQITADAIAYPTTISMGRDIRGHATPAFDKHYPGVTAQWEALRTRNAAETKRRQFDYGESFWIPLEGEHPPYGAVMVPSGGEHHLIPQAQAERLAVLGAVREAVRQLRAREQRLGQSSGRLLLALPAFRMGTGGSRDQEQAAAKAEVQAARDALDEEQHAGVDVVFVTYTPRHYQLFLDARCTLGLAPAIPSGAPPEELIHALGGGHCVLFVGAGLSKAAGMKDFKSLIRVLADDLGIQGPLPEDVDTYLDVAQWHRERFPEGDRRIHALVGQQFEAGADWAKPTVDHYWLMSLPIRYVVTTNYDSLLEKALEAQRRFPNTAVTQKDVARTGGNEGVHVIKFHGDARQDQDALVLSRDDYDRFFADRPVMASLLQGLLLNHSFFFIGYSLRDPNFRQIYSGITQMLKKAQRPAYATTFDAVSDYQERQWANKRLHLLPLRGTLEEQVHAERCLLDHVAERVTSQALLLADRAHGDGSQDQGRLSELRSFLSSAGEEVARLTRSPLTWEEAQQAARTLTFLADAGWRPKGGSLTRLWLALAERVEALGAGGHEHRTFQRSLLLSALAHAEGQEAADAIRGRLVPVQD